MVVFGLPLGLGSWVMPSKHEVCGLHSGRYRWCKAALWLATHTSEVTSTSVSSLRDFESSRSSFFPTSVTCEGKDISLVRFTYLTRGYHLRAKETEDLQFKAHILLPSLALEKKMAHMTQRMPSWQLYSRRNDWKVPRRVTKYKRAPKCMTSMKINNIRVEKLQTIKCGNFLSWQFRQAFTRIRTAWENEVKSTK